MHIELTLEEAGRLRRILFSYYTDLRMEIADTDRADFREGLKEDERFLENLLVHLEAGTTTGSSG